MDTGDSAIMNLGDQAYIRNLEISQGSSFSKTWRWDVLLDDGTTEIVDLTGYTARLVAKSAYDGTTLLDLTTENGGLVLGGSAGTIRMIVTSAQSGAMDYTYPLAVYKLELYIDSDEINLLQGHIRLQKGTI